MTSSDMPADGSDIAGIILAASEAFDESLRNFGDQIRLLGDAVLGYRKVLRMLGIDPDTGQLRGRR